MAVHPHSSYAWVGEGNNAYLVAEDLLPTFRQVPGMEEVHILVKLTGSEAARCLLHHPFLEKTLPIIVADHVTTETGTGCVHTAPGHGLEDFIAGKANDLEILVPVDEEGRFNEQAPKRLLGVTTQDGNKVILSWLEEKGRLLASQTIDHSYPCCWRCHTPLLFRATEQWFLRMEHRDLRQKALQAVNDVKWVPSWGQKRIGGMLEARPDWCLSRQRVWGVPIPMFICKECGTPTPARGAVERFKGERGADVWWTDSNANLLGRDPHCKECGGELEGAKDILDVWFDSGVSHWVVLGREEGMPWPADCYLEGSDQHRGWFHTSLLTSLFLKEAPPYKEVVTHGFTLDSKGYKMSKSLGNVIDPMEVCNKNGAEILRLWVASVDFFEDVRLSWDLIKQNTETYRKLRNSIRFMLGNLADFDPAVHAVPTKDLQGLDQWMLYRFKEVIKGVVDAYGEYNFHGVIHGLHRLASQDLSALYLDISKDVLYCERADHPGRRAIQTVLWHGVQTLVTGLSPIIPFTAEEAWSHIPGVKGWVAASEFYDFEGIPELEATEKARFETLVALREGVNLLLEEARQEDRLGGGLEAAVFLSGPNISEKEEFLRTFLLVSEVHFQSESQEADREILPGLKGRVEKAGGQKCPRCWMWHQTAHDHGLCPRCEKVISE